MTHALPEVTVGARETVCTAAQRTALGLNWFPDGNLGVVSNGNGSYQFYAANGSSPALISGTLSAPATQGVVGVSFYGGDTNYPYQSGGPVYVDPATGRRLLFYHAEIHPNGDAAHFYAVLGIAISDPGSTTRFYACGPILRPNMTLAQAVARTQAVEMCGAPYAVCGTNFLVYFRDTLTNGSPVGLAAAQAPVSSVVAAAINHTNAVWQKYYQGSFSQLGLGGMSSPLETGNPGDSWMDVAWSSYLTQYVGTVVSWINSSNTHLNLIFSLDGINWSARTQLETDSAESFYPTLVGTGPDPNDLGQSFYVYYTYSVAGAWNRWSDAALSRRLITTLGPPVIDNGSGATNVTATAARLNGTLTAGVNASTFLLWGTADGGASANWQYTNSLGVLSQGPFFCDVSGLTPATTYYYRYAATNIAGQAIAPATATFMTPANATANGIPFAWLASFGITNTSNTVETNDPDGDGLSNLQEYIAGTSPVDSSSRFRVLLNTVTGTVVASVQAIQATGSYYVGRSRYYTLERCTDLWSGASWQPISGFTNLPGDGRIIMCSNTTEDVRESYRAKSWLAP